MKRLFWLVSLSTLLACSSNPSGGGGGGGGSDDEGGSGGSAKGGGGGTRTGGRGGSQAAGGSGEGGAEQGGSQAGSGAGGSGPGGAAMGGSGVDAGPDTMGADAGGAAGSPGCAPGSKLLVCDTTVAMPQSIKATGLFTAPPDLSKHSDRLIAFSPEPALWSDGLGKERFLLLPAGEKVDNTDPKKWVFPVGTVMVKTFFGDNKKPVETRLVRRSSDAFFPWDYFVYQWNAAGTDATLLGYTGQADSPPMWEAAPVAITLGGKPHTHTIPSYINCGECHKANSDSTGMAFIGFDEIRLNHKLLPADAKTQLESLFDRGVFKMKPGVSTITDADPTLQRVKTFIYGNCVHCHHGARGAPLDMHPDVLVANTVNKDVMASGITEPPGWKRVLPGKPEMSVLFVQAARGQPVAGKTYPLPDTGGLRPMPPVGVSVAPTGAALPAGSADPLVDIRDWITKGPYK